MRKDRRIVRQQDAAWTLDVVVSLTVRGFAYARMTSASRKRTDPVHESLVYICLRLKFLKTMTNAFKLN